MIAEKEFKIEEMDAASSGEVARFRAAMETVKGELIHLKHEHVWVRFFSASFYIFSIALTGLFIRFPLMFQNRFWW